MPPLIYDNMSEDVFFETGRALSMGGAIIAGSLLLLAMGSKSANSGPLEMSYRFLTAGSDLSFNWVGVILAALLLGIIAYSATYIPIRKEWPQLETREEHDILFTSFQITKILWMALIITIAWVILSAMLPNGSSSYFGGMNPLQSVGLALNRGLFDSLGVAPRLGDLAISNIFLATCMYLVADLPYQRRVDPCDRTFPACKTDADCAEGSICYVGQCVAKDCSNDCRFNGCSVPGTVPVCNATTGQFECKPAP